MKMTEGSLEIVKHVPEARDQCPCLQKDQQPALQFDVWQLTVRVNSQKSDAERLVLRRLSFKGGSKPNPGWMESRSLPTL